MDASNLVNALKREAKILASILSAQLIILVKVVALEHFV